MARLPQTGSDAGTWGEILNDFLLQTHHPDGQIKDNVITSAQIADGTVITASLEPAVQTKIDSAAPAADPVFTGSVTVPIPTNPTDAANKHYVDSTVAVGAPVTSVATKMGDVTLDKTDVGLGNVDNTSDTGKPISAAQQTALDLKFDKVGGTITNAVTLTGASGNQLVVDNGTLTVDATNHRVGIGTTAPDFDLSVYGLGSASTSLHMRAGGTGTFVQGTRSSGTITNPTATTTSNSLITMAGGGYTGTAWVYQKGEIRIRAAAAWTDLSTPTQIVFNTTPANSTTQAERMRIGSDGNVGIANTTPAVPLDVTGEIRASVAGSNANSVVTVGGTQTLTNKTLSAPTITGTTIFSGVPTTSAGGAAGNGTQTLMTDLYVQSRGTGLFTNGSGLLGNNYNMPSCTYVQNDKPVGAIGVFYPPAGSGNQTTGTTEAIPIDPSRIYEFSTDARQVSGSAGYYMALQPKDGDGNLISTGHYVVQANTNTTLAVALSPGDTTVTLTDATNWNNSADSAHAYMRSVTFWDYVDAKGYAWPAGAYSRNISGSDFYPIGGITGNVITLNAPYSGAVHAAGTQVSNGSLANTYMYIGAAGVTLTSTWTTYKGRFGGGVLPLYSTVGATTSLPQATASINVAFLTNYNIGSPIYPSQQAIGNIQITEVENGWIKFSGVTGNHTFTLPNADSTILTSNSPVTVAQGGTGRNTSTTAYGLIAAGTSAANPHQTLATGSSGQILKSNGAAALPTFQTGAKADVGLGNVDNTSDATKNTAVATLTNKTLTSPIISTISNTGTITLPTATDTLVGRATTDTLTNKRVTTRIGTVASSATPTPDSDANDQYNVTALAAAAAFGAPTGTPTDGQKLIIRVLDNGIARALTWNAIYRPLGIILPATTIVSKTLYVLCIYNTAATKWDVVSVSQET